MEHHRISIGFVAAVMLALPFQGSRADTAPKVIEEVDFAISCGPVSQEAFKHAAWTLHSFWYPEALKEFRLGMWQESIDSNRAVKTRSDLYNLGCTLSPHGKLFCGI